MNGIASECRRILIFALIGIAVGIALDNLALGLFLALVGYLAGLFLQLHKLSQWLKNIDNPPPDAKGLWEHIYADIYRLRRQSHREKDELREVIKRVETISSTLKDGIVLLNHQGHLDFWNPAAQRMLGLRNSDRGQPISHFVRSPQFVSYIANENFREPLEMAWPRMPAKTLHVQVTPFGSDERLIMLRDVTQLTKLENMRRDFIANVSHELRTPLTVINGYLETLIDHEPPAKWVKPLQQMQHQGRRMALLINDLLTLSTLETTNQDHQLEMINIEQLLQMVKNEADLLVQEKSQTLQLLLNNTTRPLQLRGNEKELHSAISNLVTNAIKYTPEGGKISLMLWEDRNKMYISVSDTGVGISAEHLPRLTERFYRVDGSRNSMSGGTGLGLAIVKHTLMRYDAELKISSELGKGSVFTCEFPLPNLNS